MASALHGSGRPVSTGRLLWNEGQLESVRSAAEGRRVIEATLTAMAAVRFSSRDQIAVDLALEEAIANALKHGNRGATDKRVTVCVCVAADRVIAEVEDEGDGFDPRSVPDPRLPAYVERAGGRGLLLMRRYMSWVRYNQRGNRVTLCKHRSN